MFVTFVDHFKMFREQIAFDRLPDLRADGHKF
jgi:hypothetical protein